MRFSAIRESYFVSKLSKDFNVGVVWPVQPARVTAVDRRIHNVHQPSFFNSVLNIIENVYVWDIHSINYWHTFNQNNFKDGNNLPLSNVRGLLKKIRRGEGGGGREL